MTSSGERGGGTNRDVRTESTEDASREPLQIKAIDIQTAPGFDSGGFSVEGFADGVTLVHGPNASGKTTVARSIQSLLWPETAAERTSLTGQFTTGTDDWWVNLTAGRGEYQKNGSSSNPPNLPISDYRERYRLALHDLLQDDTNGESFAELIQQESIGGYNLNAASDNLGFQENASSKRISEYGTATDARDKWKQSQRKEQQLKERQAQLPQLERDREEARAAKKRVEVLERAIEYQKADDRLQKAKERVEKFPESVAELAGDEAEDVENLTDQIRTARSELRDATADRADARGAIIEADLPDGGDSGAVFTALKEYHKSLEALEKRRSTTKERLEEASARRTAAAADIPLELEAEGDALAGLSPAGWKEMEQYHREATSVTSKRDAYEAITSWLADEEVPDADRSTLQNGRRALEEWLSEPPSASRDTAVGEKAFRVGAISAGTVAATGVVLGAVVNPAFLVLLLVAAGVLWYAWQLRTAQTESGGTDPREAHRDSFRRLDLSEPDSWESDEVRRRLESLYEDLARLTLAEHVEGLLPEASELEETEEALSERRAQLKERYGATPDSTDAELVAITKGILRWQEEHEEVEAANSELTEITTQITEQTERLKAKLEPFGYETVDDAASVAGYLEEINERKQRYELAVRELEDARKRTEKARKTIQQRTSERQAIYEDCGLDDGEFARLDQLCGQVESYREATDTLRRERDRCEDRENDLETYQAYEPALKDRDIAELKSERAEADETASRFNAIDEEIRDIEADIRAAKGSTDVEEKRTAFNRALDGLESRYEADRAAMVGDTLLQHLRDVTEETSRPAVFSRANELLVKITHGQYELLLDNGQFRAKDTVRDRGFGLDELSSATRLQLLLAVRVAFVEQQETGYKLPLLLDETLANADDERAEAIIESVVELARDGRQILYFTAQGDEVAKWQRVLEDATDVTGTTIDLAAQRGLDNTVEVPAYEELILSDRDLPDPDDHDYQTYADALEVPPFAPRRGAQSAHLWYVVGDTAMLHTLLTVGVQRWGQLKTLLDSAVEVTIIDSATQEEIYHNGVALEEYVKSWRVGRGERVDRTALKDSGAVSPNFIDRVSSLAEECNGDAEAILEALHDGQVSRFHTDKMRELEHYFRDNGYLPEVETLSPDTIIMRVIGQFTSNGYPADKARERAHALFVRLQQRSNQPSRA